MVIHVHVCKKSFHMPFITICDSYESRQTFDVDSYESNLYKAVKVFVHIHGLQWITTK